MKIVPMFFARVPSKVTGKVVKTRHRMTLEDIQRAGGTPIEETVELREIPETDEERRRSNFNSAPGQFKHRN